MVATVFWKLQHKNSGEGADKSPSASIWRNSAWINANSAGSSRSSTMFTIPDRISVVDRNNGTAPGSVHKRPRSRSNHSDR